MPWLVAILVSVLVGLALAFVVYNLSQPYPKLVAFGFALTMVGAFAYTAAGCTQLFTDTLSGTREHRPRLEAALSHLRAGDTLVVWRLNRLGRSLKHLIETVQALEQRGVGFKSPTD